MWSGVSANASGVEPVAQYETRLVRKDGRLVPLDITASMTTWSGQDAAMGVFRDSTRRKEAEQALQASVTRFRQLAETIREVADRIDRIRSEEKIEQDVFLMPIVESALGVIHAYEIAVASPKVVALTIGLEDYTADIGASRTAEGRESFWARSMVVNAARAAGVSPIDSVFSDVADMEALRRFALESKGLGFDGMGCIHPRQIDVVHRAFAPEEKESGIIDASTPRTVNHVWMKIQLHITQAIGLSSVVGDDDGRSPVPSNLKPQHLLDDRLRFVVESTGRLVQQQNLGLDENRPQPGNALLLSDGERPGLLPETPLGESQRIQDLDGELSIERP